MACTFPYKSGREQYALWMTAINQYREENTRIYNLIMSTIDLSGIREETDIDYLARHFHHGIHRDGQGLIGWIAGLNHLFLWYPFEPLVPWVTPLSWATAR